MKKRTLILLSLSLAVLMAVSVFAIARPRRAPDAYFNYIDITKTYDLYGVICPSDPCCEQGKCLGTMDAYTCLNLCGLTFTAGNTEYWVYQDGIEVGSCVNGVCVPVCICKNSDDGRVQYNLVVKAKNPGVGPSWLTGATLCLAASVDNYVGSNYDQIHITDPVLVGTPARQKVVLPDPENIDSGENVILCKLCP